MAEKKITVLDKIEAGNYKVPRFKLLPPAPPILLKKALRTVERRAGGGNGTAPLVRRGTATF